MKLDKKKIFGRITIALGKSKAADIAKMFGLTAGAVSQWKNTGNISLENLNAVSLSSGVSIHWLVTGEGEKFLNIKSKPLALVSSPADTAADQRAPSTIPADESASLPLVGKINQKQQLTTSEGLMPVPAVLIQAERAVIKIEGEGWTGEGLRNGDLLIVEPVNGTPIENRIVVASLPGDRWLVRRLKSAGEMIALLPVEGRAPTIRFPAEDVRVDWIVISITRLYDE